MHISKRIQAITHMVSPGYAVCDVGCDHAYTAIVLALNGKCPYAVASDVRPGPLAAAAENIKMTGTEDKIEVCLADGVPSDILEMLPKGRKSLIITGMGGLLICRILDEAGERAAAFDEMILSPQSDPELVRGKLREMRFDIMDEEMLVEEGKFYTVIKAVKAEPGGEGVTVLSRAECSFGPVLLRKKHPVLREYLDRQKRILGNICESLEKAGRGPEDEGYREVMKKKEVLDEAEGYYGSN